MRIDKYFSDLGLFSRKEIVIELKRARITVDGKIVKNPSFNIDETKNKICLDGKEVVYQKYIYCILNKPSGYVTATVDKIEKTIYDILPKNFINKNVMPVGRLDKDTTGLLILTNDGELNHKLTSPKHNVEKEYYFELIEDINLDDVKKLEQGIDLKDGLHTKPAKINMINSKSGYIIITEGKYHQIKRMFGAISNKITKLKRVRESNLVLDENELKEGQIKYLSQQEITKLLNV